ncbi:MAG: hypothetical protein JSR47_05125 [Proteobacteria bacterium]|nr:hypothetical protein [Pseudomonadota bacterium]
MNEAAPSGIQPRVGFMTLAIGSPDYAEMAVDMALSLREWHNEPIAIMVDEPIAAYIAGRHPAIFDFVVRLPSNVPFGWACKFAVAEVSPFSRTVFIDADTIVLGSLDAVLTDAERVDFAMIGVYRKSPTSERFYGISLERLMRQFGLAHYFRNHTGVFAFERDYGRAFLAECLHVWNNELCALSVDTPADFEGIGDELIAGIVASRRGMATMREPFPVYWPEELLELRPDNRWKPLCHFHARVPHHVLKWLMEEVRERRVRADVSSTSVEHWLRKLKRRRLSSGWTAGLQDSILRRRLARGRREAHTSIIRQAPTIRTPFVSRGIWNFSNLLLHDTCFRQGISTPHRELTVEENASVPNAPPAAVAMHFWPAAPNGLHVLVRWTVREAEPAIEIVLKGPLPVHPQAVFCLRFRGRQAKELEPALPLNAGARATLISAGSLRNSALAIGVGGDYLASTPTETDLRTADQEVHLPPRQWPADRDELFVEFRLALASLEAVQHDVRIELSHCFLGQGPNAFSFVDRPKAAFAQPLPENR